MTQYEKNVIVYRKMLHEVTEKCTDLELLDLVYKLIADSIPTLYLVDRLPCSQERSKAA